MSDTGKLTALGIKAAKPGKHFDGGGLYLEAMPNGARYWRMKYRHGGRENRLAYKRVQAGDVVPGRIYQALDSQLGRAAKVGNEASHYVGRVRDAIREAMDGSISSGDQAAWRELRRQYGNRKTIRDLVATEAGEDIAPRALMGRVNSTGAGKERMATP